MKEMFKLFGKKICISEEHDDAFRDLLRTFFNHVEYDKEPFIAKCPVEYFSDLFYFFGNFSKEFSGVAKISFKVLSTSHIISSLLAHLHNSNINYTKQIFIHINGPGVCHKVNLSNGVFFYMLDEYHGLTSHNFLGYGRSDYKKIYANFRLE